MSINTAVSLFFKRMLTRSAYLPRPPTLPARLRGSYGGRHTVTMLAGDGVGPEHMQHVKQVFRYAGVPVDFEEVQMDKTVSDEQYEHALLALRRNGVALKGNVETDLKNLTGISRNMELRTELDLFANVVKVKNIPGVPCRHQGIDIVIIRENTEGEYSSLEHESVDGVVESLKIITRKNSTRIAKYAFEYAVQHGRKKVTAVHKANIMKLGDGLFLQCCTDMSKKYPQIEFENMIVDNCSMQMVSSPEQFDVMVLPNLYGNIIANIGAGLIGGPGLVAGANIGQEYAVFETGTRNTGKNVAGKDIANPCAMLLASADMLAYLGLEQHSDLIKESVYTVLSQDKIHTPDVGGNATTTQVIQAVIERIKEHTK